MFFNISDEMAKRKFLLLNLFKLIYCNQPIIPFWGGHMGLFKTSERILDRYFWPSLSHDVEMHIKHCLDCRKTKPHSMHARPPLKPLPQPGAPNHRIHIDLFGPLATPASGKKYILIITNSFTKYVELVALSPRRQNVWRML